MCVRASTIGPSAGEGLFAARALSPGEIVAFYGGVRWIGAEEGEDDEEDEEEGPPLESIPIGVRPLTTVGYGYLLHCAH